MESVFPRKLAGKSKGMFVVAVILSAAAVAIGADVEHYFSPRGGATEACVKVIGEAKTSIRMQCYGFTSQPICDALVAAKKRGVDVQVISDKRAASGRGELLAELRRGKVQVYLDGKHSIAHNKVMIVDEKKVVSGSFNFTSAAEKSNAENLLIITDQDLASEYEENWREHREHSEAYSKPKGDKET